MISTQARLRSIYYLEDVLRRLRTSILQTALFDDKKAKRLATYEHKINLIYRDLLENESEAVCSDD